MDLKPRPSDLLLRRYQVAYGQILDHRHRVSRTRILDQEYLVHAPDRLNGELTPGTRVMVQALPRSTVCTHRLLARDTPRGWIGANPHVSQKILLQALARDLIPGHSLVARYPTVEGVRLDALWSTPRGQSPLQIKSVNCCYASGRQYLFPSKNQAEDAQRTREARPYRQTISPRCLRQAQVLRRHGGSILYVVVGSPQTVDFPLVINPLDQAYCRALRQVKTYVARIFWTPEGSLYLRSFQEIL